MKRLDLSYLPINLEVGETMEVIDQSGKTHLIRCEQVESDNSLCDGCFFSKIANTFICNHVKCSKREREQEVRYIELPVKNEFKEEEREIDTLTLDDLLETGTIKEGEIFIYVDEFDKPHRIKVNPLGNLTLEQACKKCCFNKSRCCLICRKRLDGKSDDDVYYEELSFE